MRGEGQERQGGGGSGIEKGRRKPSTRGRAIEDGCELESGGGGADEQVGKTDRLKPGGRWMVGEAGAERRR